jgi:uncharacterized membrane protein YphA (DoxX/SURF4 family)
MDLQTARPAWGWRVFGLGVMALGVLALAWGGFHPGQPVPKDLPGYAALAYAAAAFMFVAGAAMQWRRTTAWAAVAIAVYFGLIVYVVMNGRVMWRHPGVFMAYSGSSEQLAIAAAAVMIFAAHAGMDARLAARLTRICQAVIGVCVVLFGLAHFAYLNMTAPLVPAWLPPSQTFWAHATGVAQIAAGLAMVSGVKARPAAILLAVMYMGFAILVHARLVAADPSNHMAWAENVTNFVLLGVAWVVADSLARPRGLALEGDG